MALETGFAPNMDYFFLQLTLTSSWRSIRKLIKEDPRYSKFSSQDRVSKQMMINKCICLKEACLQLYMYHILYSTIFFGQKREEEFNQYLRDKLADAKGDFRQLLKETHSLTYK